MTGKSLLPYHWKELGNQFLLKLFLKSAGFKQLLSSSLLNSPTLLFYSFFSCPPCSFIFSSALLISDCCDDQFRFSHSLDPLRGCQLLEHVSLQGARPYGSLHHSVAMPLRQELHCIQPLHIFHLPAYLLGQAPVPTETPAVLFTSGQFLCWRTEGGRQNGQFWSNRSSCPVSLRVRWWFWDNTISDEIHVLIWPVSLSEKNIDRVKQEDQYHSCLYGKYRQAAI